MLNTYLESILSSARPHDRESLHRALLDYPLVYQAAQRAFSNGYSVPEGTAAILAAVIQHNRMLQDTLSQQAQNAPPRPIVIDGVLFTPMLDTPQMEKSQP